MKLIKKAISLKYFSEILKFPPDLSQALYSFISEQTEPNSVKQKFYLSKIRSQNPKTKNFIVLENKNEIVENPLFLKQLFPFKEDEDYIECRSDNHTNYPPFKIAKTSIRKVSIVLGVIRME